MLTDALTGHVEMTTKFIQSLSIVPMELVQQGTAGGIGQSFKNVIHTVVNMQLNGCIFGPIDKTSRLHRVSPYQLDADVRR